MYGCAVYLSPVEDGVHIGGHDALGALLGYHSGNYY